MQAAILANSEALPEIVRALRRDLIPNGEAMLAEHFRTAAAGARTTASLGHDKIGATAYANVDET